MSNITVEEKAQKLFDRFTDLEYKWSCDPTNERLRKLTKSNYLIYVGFCVKNDLDWVKVAF